MRKAPSRSKTLASRLSISSASTWVWSSPSASSISCAQSWAVPVIVPMRIVIFVAAIDLKIYCILKSRSSTIFHANPIVNAPLSVPQQEQAFLARLGERVRAWRTEHGMTRKQLSVASGVSERYLAQLEAGQGNMSVLLLRKVARAMGVSVERLVREDNGEQRPIALLGLRGA